MGRGGGGDDLVDDFVLEDVPYVLLQPYLERLLEAHALEVWTPAVVGGVIAAMMATSAGVSGWAVSVRSVSSYFRQRWSAGRETYT